MDIQKILWKVIPDGVYTVREAARYLGVHRCTIYAYIKHSEKPLSFLKHNQKMMFQGTDLIAYKAGGLPKRGRKSKSTKRSQYPLLNLKN